MIPLLMTRPLARSQTFVQELPYDARAKVIPHYAPMWEMAKATGAAPDCDAAIFTSSNGVAFGPEAGGRTAYCVGARTTQVAADAGWRAVQTGQDAEELVRSLIALKPNARLVHVSGQSTRGDVAKRLSAAGLMALRHVAYVQKTLPLPPDAEALLQRKQVIVPLFSPDGAAHFAVSAPKRSRVHAAVLSRAVSDALGDFRAQRVAVAAQPNAQALGDALRWLVQTWHTG